MSSDNLNIMNLLLGSLPQTNDPSLLGGSKPSGEVQSTGFDLILDQLMMSLGETESGSLDLINGNTKESLLKSDNQSSLLQNGKENSGISNGSDNFNNNDLISNLQLNAITTNELKNNLVTDSSGEIDSKFKVLNWNIIGENVNLDLVSEHNPETIIKVTIPAKDLVEQLSGSNNSLNSTFNRVPLDGQNITAANQLKELLAKYDIKELHINTSENKSDAVPNKNEVNVEIFAQNAGQEIVLKSKLNKNAIKIKNNLLDKKSIQAEEKANRVGFDAEQSKLLSVKHNLQKSTMNLSAKSKVMENFDLMKQFSDSNTTQDVKTDNASQLPDFIKSPTEMTLTKDKVNLQPVRFTLPDNINSQLKTNGKSVRINIEPDNLGPARLSLNIHNDKLRAVVSVNSVQAKMTVEGSLDRLLDALNKANIQVDYIDVDVNQQNSYEQFAQQRPNYLNKHSNRNFSLSDYLTTDESIIKNKTPNGVSYVNANGVNLTA